MIKMNVLLKSKTKFSHRTFSVFNKLKEFIKGGEQQSGSVTPPVEADKIKVIYEDEEKDIMAKRIFMRKLKEKNQAKIFLKKQNEPESIIRSKLFVILKNTRGISN
jgi:hypothetical protein